MRPGHELRPRCSFLPGRVLQSAIARKLSVEFLAADGADHGADGCGRVVGPEQAHVFAALVMETDTGAIFFRRASPSLSPLLQPRMAKLRSSSCTRIRLVPRTWAATSPVGSKMVALSRRLAEIAREYRCCSSGRHTAFEVVLAEVEVTAHSGKMARSRPRRSTWFSLARP